jgi:site-specific DNA recombinase
MRSGADPHDRRSAMPERILRCAVYTRKSSEEGLEQDFNSLHAQREACEAYIASQKHEGWQLLPASYDDGGYSGGSMNRSGLTRLLADVAAKRIDVVVVYKVDRLTRLLADFARIVAVFDAEGVSFVSVTQAFNTTTSMGRLTLNVLLSFAQFEREVTGERIRDKIAASKRKGLWMGGFVPLGYDADGRTLRINAPEAETVRTIYALYLELGSVDAVKQQLDRRGIRTKVRQDQRGAMAGGRPFTRGHLYRLLQSPLYIGQIRHRADRYDGQHPAILDKETWMRVQDRLKQRGGPYTVKRRARHPSLLAGLLHDEAGVPFKSTHAVKDGKRYRYYVRATDEEHDRQRGWWVPANAIESLVLDQLKGKLLDAHWISEALAVYAATPDELRAAFAAGEKHASALGGSTDRTRQALDHLVFRIIVFEPVVRIDLRAEALLKRAILERRKECPRIDAVADLRRRPREHAIVLQSRSLADRSAESSSMLKAIARGHAWFAELARGEVSSIDGLAAREGVSDRYASTLLKLAFLAPSIVDELAAGHASLCISTKCLTLDIDLPRSWADQQRLLGPADS